MVSEQRGQKNYWIFWTLWLWLWGLFIRGWHWYPRGAIQYISESSPRGFTYRTIFSLVKKKKTIFLQPKTSWICIKHQFVNPLLKGLWCFCWHLITPSLEGSYISWICLQKVLGKSEPKLLNPKWWAQTWWFITMVESVEKITSNKQKDIPKAS